MDVEKAVKHLRDNAEDTSSGRCAKYVRQALQAGGLDLKHHPVSAKDYGPTLLASGFKKHHEFRRLGTAQAPGRSDPTWTDSSSHDPGSTVLELVAYALDALGFRDTLPVSHATSNATAEYVATKGDIAVIQPYSGGDPNGHIAMYDGTQWVSDFTQRDLWGGPSYRKHKPDCVIYRP